MADPTGSSGQVARIEQLCRERGFKEALDLADRVLSADGADPRTYHLKALALRELRRLGEAEAFLTGAPEPLRGRPELEGELAFVLYLKDRYDDAITVADRVLAHDPGNESALKAKAGSLRRRKDGGMDLEAAARVLEAGLTLRPGSAVLLAERAALYAAEGKPDEALRVGRAALEIDPGVETAAMVVAREYSRRREYSSARAVLDEALKVNPASLEFLVEQGSLLLKEKNGLQKAIECGARIRELDPQDERGYGLESDARALKGNIRGAERVALDAIERFPQSIETALRLFHLALSEGRFEEAGKWLERARSIDEDGKDERVLTDRLFLVQMQGRWSDARTEIEAVLSAAPDSANVRRQVAALYSAMRLFQDAHDVLDEGARRNLDRMSLALGRIETLNTEGRFSESWKMVKELEEDRESFEENPDAIVAAAWVHANEGSFRRSHELLARALAMNAHHEIACTVKADALVTEAHSEEEIQRAEKYTLECLQHFPNSQGLGISLGQVRLRRDPEGALEALDRVLRGCPVNTLAMQVKSRVLFHMNRLGAAEEVVEAGLARCPFSMGLLSERGFLRLFGNGDIQGAERDFRTVVERSKMGLLARTGLGAIALQRRDYREAERWFREVARAQHFDATAVVNLAWTITASGDTGRLGEAEGLSRQALRIHSGEARAYGCLGVIAFHRGHHARAEHYLLRALEINGDDIDSRLNLGALYSRTGRYAEARRELECALEKTSVHGSTPHARASYARICVELGLVHLKREEYDDVHLYAREAIDANPASAGPWRTLAFALIREKKPSEAERILREGLTRVAQGDTHRVRLDLARVLIDLGDEREEEKFYDEALTEVSVCLRDESAEVDAFLYRGLIELKQGEPKVALKWLSRVSERDPHNPDAERYRRAAQAEARTRRKQERRLAWWQYTVTAMLLAHMVLLWVAYYRRGLDSKVLAAAVTVPLALLVVTTLLPHLTKLKVATVEANLEATPRDIRQETISGPTTRIELPPSATPELNSRLLEP